MGARGGVCVCARARAAPARGRARRGDDEGVFAEGGREGVRRRAGVHARRGDDGGQENGGFGDAVGGEFHQVVPALALRARALDVVSKRQLDASTVDHASAGDGSVPESVQKSFAAHHGTD